jgi:hypothetical protein
MALNFGILQPANIAGNIMAGQQETQRNQLAQQQMAASQQQMETGALNQESLRMQIEQAKRDRDALAKMQAAFVANGKSSDLGANFDEMIQSGIPQFVEIGTKGKQTLQNQKNFESLLKGGAPAAATTFTPGALGSGTFDPAAAPKNALTAAPSTNALTAGPDVANLRRQIDAAYALGTAPALAWAQSREKELAELTKPQTAPDAVLMKQLGFPLTQEGYQAFRDAQRQDRILNPQEENQKIRIALASRPPPQPPQPPQPQPPVAVVDPATGKQVLVSREEALSKRMTPANAMEGLPPKEIQLREAKYPAATASVKAFETSAEKLAKDLETLAAHKGLSGISGLIYGRTPAITKEARAAQALYDSIVARGGFQELQNMRSSSPTGGALGNVSNQEGQYLRDAFAPINRTQDTADLSTALTNAANAARASKQRVREAYDMTYDYKNQGGGGKVVDFGSLK